jgi:hypothetical protein
MIQPFPFYSSAPSKAEADIYHTHPQCKVALNTAEEARVLGMGEDKRECPFCYLLGQFKTSRFQAENSTRELVSAETGAFASVSSTR